MKTLPRFLFVLLVVFLAVKVVNGADVYVWKTRPFKRCPMIGAATAGTDKARSNENKNRWSVPTAGQFDPRVTLAALLQPGRDERRWDSRKAGRIVGFVASVSPGGISSGESCNCKAKAAIDGDTHIDVFSSDARADLKDPSKKIIVEVTPRIRELMAAQGIDWSSSTLESRLKGKWVEFEGWLFFDPDHRTGSVHSDPNETQNPEKNWRASGWEIHPITAIRVLNGRPGNLGNLFAPRAMRLQKR